MTIRVVADTHAILWYLYSDDRLTSAANTLMETIDKSGNQIAIASITLAEIICLVEKGRVAPLPLNEWFEQ